MKRLKAIIKNIIIESIDIKSPDELSSIITKQINRPEIFYREFMFNDQLMIFICKRTLNYYKIDFGPINPDTKIIMTSTSYGNNAWGMILPIIFGLLRDIINKHTEYNFSLIKYEAIGSRAKLYQYYINKYFNEYELIDDDNNWYTLKLKKQ